MNIEKLKELKGWLEDGAPHVVFDMRIGQRSAREAIMTDRSMISEVPGDEEWNAKLRAEIENYETQRDAKGLGNCGTACCIAGYVALMGGLISRDWDDICDFASEALGLRNEHGPSFFGHDLFNQDLAPENCTPAQAAVAVQNVIDGKEPWG